MGTAADGLPDETLLAGLGAGDADLALAFVRRFQRIVFGVAMTIVGDPAAAEDVAQQGLRAGMAARPGVRLAPRVGPRLAEDDRA